MQQILAQDNVLIAGIGGGYDVFTGLPIYFRLKKMGKTVHLANFTFTSTDKLQTYPTLTPTCYQVTSTLGSLWQANMIEDPPTWLLKQMNITKEEYLKPLQRTATYFPEYYLSESLNGETIWTIDDVGGIPSLQDAYTTLVQHLGVECIVLVDGGYDSVMFGDETHLGSPIEDMMSLYVISKLKVDEKYLLCLGFGVEAEINDNEFLSNVSTLSAAGGFYGLHVLHMNDPEVQAYLIAFMECQPENSIINAQVWAALEGHRGPYVHPYVKERMNESPEIMLNLSVLTCTYFMFDLDTVAGHVKYLDKFKDAASTYDIHQIIKEYRNQCN